MTASISLQGVKESCLNLTANRNASSRENSRRIHLVPTGLHIRSHRSLIFGHTHGVIQVFNIRSYLNGTKLKHGEREKLNSDLENLNILTIILASLRNDLVKG